MTKTNYVLIFVLFTLLAFAKNSTAKTCSVQSTGVSPCSKGWELTPRPSTCLRNFPNLKTIQYRAWSKCTKERPTGFGDTFSSFNQAQYNFFKDFVKRNALNDEVWNGADDIQHDTIWRWSNGNDVVNPKPDWHAKFPSNKSDPRYSNCVYLDSRLKWVDAHCQDPRGIICQKEHRLGPRELTMKVDWHRSDRVFYIGHPMVFRSSSFIPENGRIRWKFNKAGNPVANHTSALEVTETGFCVNKSTLELTWAKADTSLQGLRATVYSRSNADGDHCHKHPTRLSFCVHSKPATILDGPKARPDVILDYEGSNLQVDRGTKVRVNCTVLTGKVGKLTWVVNFPTSMKALQGNDTKVVYSTTGTDAQNLKFELSVVEFEMNSKLNDISFTCFAHDVFHYKMKTECPDTNIFCARTAKLTAKPAPHFEEKSFWWFPWFLLLLLATCIPTGMKVYNSEEGDWVHKKVGVIKSLSRQSIRQTQGMLSKDVHPSASVREGIATGV